MELQDKIGREDIVNKICSLVDNLKSDVNFCLALNGEWGSGKTFVMQMLEQNFCEHPEYIVIQYDAWKNNFYSDPLIAILYCLLDGIKGYIRKSPEVAEQVKEGIGKTLKSWGKESLEALKNCGGKVALFGRAIEGITNILTASGKLTNHQKIAEFRSYQTLLEDVKSRLNEIIKLKVQDEKQTKLIVMVDEIDRCLPNEQLVVLERLHHLFGINGCAVIVAMNQKSIAATVNTLYGINGFEYLRKFFDFTFKLTISVDKYLLNLLNDFLRSIQTMHKDQGNFSEAVKVAYECLLYGEESVLSKIDNRDMERYYKCLQKICNDYGWEKLVPHYVFFIIVALFIRKFISSEFLNYDKIISNQEEVNIRREQENNIRSYSGMPYYDYLIEYIGVDRGNLPDKLRKAYPYGGNNIPEYSWYFNEIVAYSLSNQSVNNQIRRYEGLLPIFIEDCKRLVELVILYGGEQERNARDERQ